jgi:O-antigen/teichoic acid export membrane protein
MLSSVAGMIIGYTDTILITLFRSLPEVGIYQTAQPTARLLWFFAGAFTTVLFPLVTELKTKKSKGIETGISLIYKYIWIIIIPFALMAFCFSTEILNLFFGSFYAQGSGVLKILAMGAIFFSIVQINGTVLNGLGKPKNYTKLVYIGAIINLIGNLILIPIIGITGAAISTFLTYLVMFFFSFFELRKFVKIKIPVLDWSKTLVIGIFSLLSIYFLKNLLVINIFLEVFICFLVSISIFVGLVLLLNVINLNEVFVLVKQIIKK